MKNAQQEFKRIQNTLLGQKSGRIKQGYGSFITLDFGDEIKEVSKNGREHIFSEWYIWIYCCKWEIISSSNNVLAHFESSQEEIASILKPLQSYPLTELEYDSTSFKIALGFANGVSINLTPDDEFYEEAEYMMIFTPDKHVLSFGPKGALEYHRSDQIPAIEA